MPAFHSTLETEQFSSQSIFPFSASPHHDFSEIIAGRNKFIEKFFDGLHGHMCEPVCDTRQGERAIREIVQIAYPAQSRDFMFTASDQKEAIVFGSILSIALRDSGAITNDSFRIEYNELLSGNLTINPGTPIRFRQAIKFVDDKSSSNNFDYYQLISAMESHLSPFLERWGVSDPETLSTTQLNRCIKDFASTFYEKLLNQDLSIENCAPVSTRKAA